MCAGYSASGARLVAGVVALSRDKTKVLLITSSARPDKFVMPKGGYETDEDSPEAAALREAWEEAGIEGKISTSLGVIEDMRPAKTFTGVSDPGLGVGDWEHGNGLPPRSEFYFFEMTVEKEAEEWPESFRRVRRWVGYSEACANLKSRPELLEALRRSSIVKDAV